MQKMPPLIQAMLGTSTEAASETRRHWAGSRQDPAPQGAGMRVQPDPASQVMEGRGHLTPLRGWE